MKALSFVLMLFTFSGCSLISAFKIRDAHRLEKIEQNTFLVKIPFQYDQGHIIIEVLVDNKPLNFIFDTGASTILDADLAKKVRFQKLGVRRTTDTGNKKGKLKVVKLDTLSVAGIDFSSVVASISDLSHLQKVFCIPVSGILGTNIMNKAVWQIDYSKKVIVLANSRDSLSQPIEPKSVEFRITDSGTPKIRVSLEGAYIGDAFFDTGSGGGINLPQNALSGWNNSSKFVSEQKLVKGLFSEKIETSKTTIVSKLNLGQEFEAKKVPVSFNKILPEALIGNKFLENYLVTIDWNYQQITFSNFKATTTNPLHTFGFGTVFIDGKVIVGSILEGSSADKLGLVLKDHIVQINETDFRKFKQDDFCNWKKNNILDNKDELTITMKRADKEQTAKLQKTDYLKTLQIDYE